MPLRSRRPDRPSLRFALAPWIVTGLAVVGGVAVAVAVAVAPASGSAALPAPFATSAPLADVAAAPAPASTAPVEVGAPADATAYETAALRQIDVWTVDPALPVDDDPFGAVTGELAQPIASAPVFASPGGPPIGFLPRTATYGGTVVPVVVHDTHWVKVLLAGRQGVPPQANPAQAVGWLRVADVELSRTTSFVEVHLEARTVEIVTATGRERVASDFAWGKPSTPTPLGRTFIMLTTVVPEFAYTQGHPLVYLGVQSPTLAGFDGGDVAVTAFHYYHERSGPNSFGCVYLDGPSTDRLAQLPPGTPVIIHP